MKTVKSSLITILLVYFCCQISGATEKGSVKPGWKAGVAKVNITPRQNMWMAGYAARNKPAQGKLHDLWAKALFLEDVDGNSALLVTSDIVYFTKNISDSIRNILHEKLDLSREQIILNSSHTHSGPDIIGNDLRVTYSMLADREKNNNGYFTKLSRDYSYWLIHQIVELAVNANKALEPVNIYAENGIARFQVNRRNNKEGEILKQTELKGPNDFAVPVLKVENRQGKIKAIVFGYACHATVLNGNKWSGDYPGFAQLELEKMFEGATAMFFQGAGADQNPLPRRSLPLAVQYGRQLAASVERVLNEKMRPLSPNLKNAYSEIDLSFEASNLTPEQLLREVAKESSDYPLYRKHHARWVLNRIEAGEKINTSSYPYPVQVWKIGEQLIIALGGEVVVGYANKFKRIFGPDTFILGYSNDVNGYIPTEKVLQEGGYEASWPPIFPMLWAPGIEQAITDEVSSLFSKVDSAN